MGDRSPGSIEYVEDNRQPVVSALSSDEVENSADVDAIVMRGDFVANNAPRPSEAPAPRGSVLTLVVKATTGELTDFGIQNEAPNLTSLGPVTVAQ